MDGQHWMASAMRAARAQLDIATHNLANASTDGFRKTLAATVLGNRGLAVTEHTAHEQGAVRSTGRRFDLALLGEGAFRVSGAATSENDARGASRSDAFRARASLGSTNSAVVTVGAATRSAVSDRADTTRDGSFTRDRDGYLIDDRGRRLLGAHGALRVSADATIESDGAVRDGEHVVDRIPLPRGTRLMAGALETSTVNPIGETLAILTAQRAFETAQKTLLAIDAAREKAANDVVRLR